MAWSKSKKTKLVAGNVVNVPGYGRGTIVEFDSGCGGGELALVKLSNGTEDYFGVSRLTLVPTDKKARYAELYVRDAVWTEDGRLGLVVDFEDGGCGSEYARIIFNDGKTASINVNQVTLAVAAKR